MTILTGDKANYEVKKIEIYIPASFFCMDLLEEYWCPCLDDNQIVCRLYNKELEEIKLDDEETGLYNCRVYKCEECFNK